MEPRRVLFDGFNSATRNAILARPDFGGGDSSPIDQVYLFLFDAPLDGWLRMSETGNFGDGRLELDFVGGLDPAAIGPVTRTPEPTTLLLRGTTAARSGPRPPLAPPDTALHNRKRSYRVPPFSNPRRGTVADVHA